MSRQSAKTNTNVELTAAYFEGTYVLKQYFIPPLGVADTKEEPKEENLKVLSKLVRAKFRGSVDIYPITDFLVAGATVFPGLRSMAIRPHNSNLITAVVTWEASAAAGMKGRYIIYSPRVKKARRGRSQGVDGRAKFVEMATAVQDCRRAASFISGLSSYGDTEMASFVANHLARTVQQDVEEIRTKLNRLFSEFRFQLERSDIPTEILQILDCVAQNRPAHIPPYGALYTHYNAFAVARKQLEEKESYVGVLAPMFMFRAARNNRIVVVAPREQLHPTPLPASLLYPSVCIESYSSFDDLPQDIKRVVMTLEVKEKDSGGRVEGVGIVAHKDKTLCTEACGFVVPKATRDSFILDVEKTSTHIEGQDDRL